MLQDFNYHLGGYGWAEIFFSSDKQNVRFDFSYLSDPITEIISALLRLLNKQSETETINFYDEPGRHFLIISKSVTNDINIKIYWSDYWVESSSSTSQLIYSDDDVLSNFSKVICDGIDSLLERHTFKDYKEKWVEYEFPIESFYKLKQTIG
ncbi:MAG: hypothetical protein ABIN67_16140 [Ferruginibacter sp.]